MELKGLKKIVVFGGSFDPPHVGHVRLPELVREKIGADVVLYVPAGRAPHKLEKKQSDASDRVAMLRLALQDMPRAVVSELEINRGEQGQPTYTVDTLRQLRGLIDDDAEMRLLVGADQVLIWKQWRDWREIEKIAEPVVMVRPPETLESLLGKLDAADRAAWSGRILELPMMDISSTAIRDGEGAAGDVCNAVRAYIKEHHLYGR